jgi:TMEM175 potassium channel family protein
MRTTYNQVAGQSVERLAALSDGVFAVAMTLLVLDLHGPAIESIHSEVGLWVALQRLGPRLLMFAMSFLTLGIFWVGQQTQLNHLERSERSLTWLHLLFLFAVSLTPFSTALLAEFLQYRVALLAYWANIGMLGGTLLITWTCATRGGLVRSDLPAATIRAVRRRIVYAQSFYAFGAALCAIDTYWSIGFIVAVQLCFALGLEFPRRRAKSREL